MSDNTHTMTGRIIKRGPVEEFGAKKFRKAILVVHEEGQKYPQPIPFEVTRDALKKYADLRDGDEVEISYNLRGREWNGKNYSSLEAWMIKRPGGISDAPADDALPVDVESDAQEGGGDEEFPF